MLSQAMTILPASANKCTGFGYVFLTFSINSLLHMLVPMLDRVIPKIMCHAHGQMLALYNDSKTGIICYESYMYMYLQTK